MHADDALLGRDAEAEREAVVAGTAVNVEAIGAAGPEAVIGDLREQADDGRLDPEAEQPELASVGVAREDEIAFAYRQMAEGAGIVEQHQPERAGHARVLFA